MGGKTRIVAGLKVAEAGQGIPERNIADGRHSEDDAFPRDERIVDAAIEFG